MIVIDPSSAEDMDFWRAHNPAVVDMVEGSGRTADSPAAAFVCQNFTCLAPTGDPAKLRAALAAPRGAARAPPAAPPLDVGQLLGSAGDKQ